MILTEQCKKDFEKYFFTKVNRTVFYSGLGDININSIWGKLPSSMKYGVLVDFFDSVGVDIRIGVNNVVCVCDMDELDYESFNCYSPENRQEARTKVIERANEIYNNK